MPLHKIIIFLAFGRGKIHLIFFKITAASHQYSVRPMCRISQKSGRKFCMLICVPIIGDCRFRGHIHMMDAGITTPPLKTIDAPSVKMKTKNLVIIAFVSMVLCAIGVLGFLEAHYRSVILRHIRQHQILPPDGDRSVSISKGTILLLLAVGVIGALSVRRKNKDKGNPVRHQMTRTTSKDRDAAFIMLNKQYLHLQYKVTQHKFSGNRPPDCLLKEISDIERKVRLISRALE